MNVVYYYPWTYFYPIRSGAAAVAAAHLAYFRSRGYKPRILIAGDCRASGRRQFERHYSWVEDIVAIHVGDYPAIADLQRAYTFGSCLMWHAAMCQIPAVRDLFAKPTDLVYLNYAFSAPLLDLAPKNAARVLESVDIISRQYQLLRHAPLVQSHNLRAELELYRLFDVVVMINEDEDAFARRRGAENTTYVPRSAPLPDEPFMCERAQPHFDLLMVGSNHPPNVEGAAWFYEHVFRPRLKPRGLRWAIAGSMCDYLRIDDSSVTMLDGVENIAAAYQDTKIVVVPILSGAGISIKTLEALGHGKPVVTTPCGCRGLRGCDDALVCCNFSREPSETAERIIALCASAELRENLGAAAREYIRDNFSYDVYGRRMDQVLWPLTNRQETCLAA